MKRGIAVIALLSALGSKVGAVEKAPLIHDKRIHGQTVKLEVGQRLEVRVSGGCFWEAVAIGGDSIECVDEGNRTGDPERSEVFGFLAKRPGRTRVLLAMYGPGGKAKLVDFSAEVTGEGKATPAEDVPLLLYRGASNETFHVAVGRKIEFRLQIDSEGGVWKATALAGDAVRHDADPKDKDAARVLKFSAVRTGAANIKLERTNSSRDIDLTVTIEAKNLGKGVSPDTF